MTTVARDEGSWDSEKSEVLTVRIAWLETQQEQ